MLGSTTATLNVRRKNRLTFIKELIKENDLVNIINETGNKEFDFILKMTVPIYVVNTEKEPFFPEQVASGFLFKSNDRLFLITAGHLIRKYGTRIYLTLSERRQFPPSGELLMIYNQGSTPGGELDNIDVAVICLDSPDALFEEYEMCNFSDFFIDPIASQDQFGSYLVCGFPSIYSEHNKDNETAVAKFLIYNCRYVNKYISKDYTKEIHYAIEYTRQTINSNTGNSAIAPLPNGVSGSALWKKMTDRNGMPHYKIVGVFIEYHNKQDVVYALRIHHILKKIREYYKFEEL
jgi:hypothetical protein